MDTSIKAIKMKPKVRIVASATISCDGCDVWKHVKAEGLQLPFRCDRIVHVHCGVNHIKVVGSAPSTR